LLKGGHMPKKLQSCLKKVKKKGVKNPYGICISSTGQKPHKKKGKK